MNKELIQQKKTKRAQQRILKMPFEDVLNLVSNLEFLQEIADSGLPVPVVVTYAANISYTGDLVLTGEIQKDENTGLATLNFMGGELTKI